MFLSFNIPWIFSWISRLTFFFFVFRFLMFYVYVLFVCLGVVCVKAPLIFSVFSIFSLVDWLVVYLCLSFLHQIKSINQSNDWRNVMSTCAFQNFMINTIDYVNRTQGKCLIIINDYYDDRTNERTTTIQPAKKKPKNFHWFIHSLMMIIIKPEIVAKIKRYQYCCLVVGGQPRCTTTIIIIIWYYHLLHCTVAPVIDCSHFCLFVCWKHDKMWRQAFFGLIYLNKPN